MEDDTHAASLYVHTLRAVSVLTSRCSPLTVPSSNR